MRLVSYLSAQPSLAAEGPRIAALRGERYIDLSRANLPTSMRALLALGAEGLKRAERAAAEGAEIDPATIKKLLAPVPDAQKVICVGLNYADHARETGGTPPEEPVIFSKFATALLGHGEAIVLPRVSQQVDYEAELVAVIGRRGRDIPRASAYDYIAGYCPGHDVSARDWQTGKPSRQWLLGKSFDTFAPCGPAIVTRDEVPDPCNLGVRFRLNGESMQNSNTNQFIFPVDEIVAYVSQVCTLEPGDLIFTGTPPGVGVARKPQVFMKSGDVAEVEIDGLGVLRNPVVAA